MNLEKGKERLRQHAIIMHMWKALEAQVGGVPVCYMTTMHVYLSANYILYYNNIYFECIKYTLMNKKWI